jgi:hypothetical protein
VIFLNAMALLLLFCCSIISAVRRWLKTQAAAEMGAANEAVYQRLRRVDRSTNYFDKNLTVFGYWFRNFLNLQNFRGGRIWCK